MWPRKLPPLITTAVLAMLLVIVGFWGYAVGDAKAVRIARIERTHARLNDAEDLTFAARVTLHRRFDQWAFQRHEGEIRQALVSLLRTKSRYMVSNPVAREALTVQMLREVNRVLNEPVADELELTEFVLS
jgi:flagellar basal body-associated protein FliL